MSAATEARNDAAIAAWLALCEKHELDYDDINAARLAYDESRDIIPSSWEGLVPLRLLLMTFFEHGEKAPLTEDFLDWEVGPLLLSHAMMAGFLLGKRSAHARKTDADPR